MLLFGLGSAAVDGIHDPLVQRSVNDLMRRGRLASRDGEHWAKCVGAVQAKLAEKESQIQDLVQQLSELLDASNSLKSQNSMLTRMLKLSPQCCTEQQCPSEIRQQQSLQPQVSAGMNTGLVQRGPTGTRPPPSGMPWQEDKHAEGITLTVKGAQPIQLTADQVGGIPGLLQELTAPMLATLQSCADNSHGGSCN